MDASKDLRECPPNGIIMDKQSSFTDRTKNSEYARFSSFQRARDEFTTSFAEVHSTLYRLKLPRRFWRAPFCD
jgi:hypothetical protein